VHKTSGSGRFLSGSDFSKDPDPAISNCVPTLYTKKYCIR
jgi:hypothetical protein